MPKGGKSKKKQPDGVKYDSSSVLQCPDCLEMVHVGTAGPANLVNHKAACKGRPKGKMQKISDLFAPKPHAPLVPSTVSSTPLLIPSTSTASGNESHASIASSPLRQSSPGPEGTLVGSDDSSFLDYGAPDASHAADSRISVHGSMAGNVPTSAPFGPGYDALHHLRFKVEQIPAHIRGDPLVDFAGDPADFFGSSEPQDRDKIIHNLLERNFGSNSWAYSMGAVQNYLYRGANGLDAFCDFFEYFVRKRGFPIKSILDIILFLEEGIELLFLEEGIEFEFQDVADIETRFGIISTSVVCDNPGQRVFTSGALEQIRRARPPRECCGWKLILPEGQNPHTSYPFGLHAEHSLPWGYEFANGSLFLRANTCNKCLCGEEEQCESCTALFSDPNLRGILDRILNGVHENSRLAFHPIANLVEMYRRRTEQLREKKLLKLNDTRTVLRKMTTIDNQKELTMAIASGKSRANGAGTNGVIELCRRAALGEYKPLNDEREKQLAVAMWRVGGGRLAEIAHRAMGLPSLTTLRRNTTIRPLLPSAGRPRVEEIEYNIDSCLDATPEDDSGPQIVHQVLMLDEIATEKRARYDDRTNKVVGICRQHGWKLPLDLRTEDDLNVLCKEVKDGNGHLAGEATVAALGTLTSNPRLYAARPILFSADCKLENGAEHAVHVLRPLISAIKNKSKRKNTTYRVICVSSDVGDDDITADKDAKHALKCLRNLTMRDAGIKIRGFRITAAIIKEHLGRNDFFERTIRSLLNPNDRQDVLLAFSLLKAIWELPNAPSDSTPTFARARKALQIFGKLGYYLIMPYVCIDLDLSAQLTYLSAAAHLLLDLYVHDNARTAFMPTQTFINLMVMIKNVFFCVAKTKVDIPNGKFWLILLGTDRLETFFGLLRSAIGPDSNVDLLQLANRGSGLCEIAVIMALYPEWDRAPRRLKLPAVGEAGQTLTSKFDHINPTSWKGNTEPLMEIYDEEDIEAAYQSLELEAEFPSPPSAPMTESETTYAGDDDVEDAMGVEEPRGGFDTKIDFNGTRLSKAKALRLAMAGLAGPRTSTDRTKRVASIPCYLDTGIYDNEPQILGGPCIRIDNPICTLLRCEEQLFLAIGAVNSLSFGTDKIQEISLDFLSDRDAKVSFEVMCLVRTTVEDDPTKQHDWCWSQHMDRSFVNIPGRLIQPLNPALSIRTPTKPTYLFQSSELMAFGATLLERLSSEDIRLIPNATRTENFPYRFQAVPLDISHGQRILEHCAAHLLYDSSINRQHELCGLCMRPAPMCVFYLKKVNGNPQIDWERSTCKFKISFRNLSRNVNENQRVQSISPANDGETPANASKIEGPLPERAESDDEDLFPTILAPARRGNTAHRRIDSDDESDDDVAQPSSGDVSATGLEGGHGDGAGDDVVDGTDCDREPLVSNAPQETARVSADVEKDATAHAPIVESPNPVPAEPQSFQDKPPETADEKTLPAKRARRTTKC
ncbi:hypothetical protein B0H13DRAFT_1919358 [Mycena leptocephala]|nr:hypothetical protein B0H13DRAFT_1919358 [Mycena leptocephala]